jgi:hypothetical protein
MLLYLPGSHHVVAANFALNLLGLLFFCFFF